ncbi:restriction endonuclease subunit S [Lysobacter olei]
MKDSGVEWLGKVPAHWKIVPPGVLFTDSKERAHCGDQMLSATQKYGVIPLAEFESLEQRQVTKASTNFDMRKHVEIGDFVISMRSMDGGLERSHAVGSVRSSYSVLKASQQVHGPYFGALMKCSLYVQALRLTSSFIRDGQDLSFNHVKKIKLPLPDLEEQVAIAEYLDRAMARIDALVAKKTHFINLLREKRQATITHAVTKGLDARVAMKDSGVKWLGYVPKNWSVAKLNFRFSVDLGKMLDEKRMSGKHPVPYLRNRDVQWTGINTQDLPVMDIHPNEIERYTAIREDLLVCEGGEVGRSAVWMGERIGYQKALHRLRPRIGDSPKFMYYALMAASASGAFNEGDTKSTISHLPAEKFRTYRFAFPPKHEQIVIVAHLDRATSRIDALIANTERSIELLREHRTALITAAVTGKIDLRDAA